MLDSLSIALGLIVLVGGGELVVRGASRLALGLGLSPLVIGLTVVAFGTSSPELAVGIGATLGGTPDVAVGNVVGSNIYNILLILGVAALIRPLMVRRQLVRFDVPVVIGVSVLLWLLVLDGRLSALEGALLVVLLALYLAISFWLGRRGETTRTTDTDDDEPSPTMPEPVSRVRSLAVFLAGLVALVVGAQLLVGGATGMATALGVPDLVIGLTVVAIGTSLPELITSAIAALRGHRDIAVGNVMGSNLFNILGILGITAVVGGGLPVAEQVRTFDLAVMTVVAFACLPLLFTGWVLRRWEGALFVGYAVLYTAYVVLAALRHPLVEPLEMVTVVFALPLTAIVLVSVTLREFGRGDGQRRWLRRRPGRQAS